VLLFFAVVFLAVVFFAAVFLAVALVAAAFLALVAFLAGAGVAPCSARNDS
jgi:hypothetical protein